MKLRSYLFMGLAAAALTACNEDFNDDIVQQQPNEQPTAVTFAGDGAVAEVATIDFKTLPAELTLDDSVKVCNITMPTSTFADKDVEFKLILNNEKELDMSAEGKVLASELKTYVESTYGRNPEITRDMQAVVMAYVGNADTKVRQQISSGTFQIHALTDAPFIDFGGYYMVGSYDNWACKLVEDHKFTNKGGQSYADQDFVFTYSMPSPGDGELQFKLVPASAFNEEGGIANWDIALACLSSDNDGMSGVFSWDNKGDNFKFQTSADYKKYIFSFDLMNGTYKIEGVKAELYMTGNYFGWGDVQDGKWTNYRQLVPVNGHDDEYWTIVYLHADEQFKFAPENAWSGDFGGSQLVINDVAGAGVGADGTNTTATNAGWYLLHVINGEKEKTLNVLPANVYLIGGVVGGNWNVADENLFTVPDTDDGEFVSREFTNDDQVRMCVAIYPGDWWRTEFIVFEDGKIAYRGTGGDQERYNVKAGQKAYLNFKTDTGRYE